MIEPMTDAEWQEFGRMTLHGSPPWETLQRIFATVDTRGVEVEGLRADLEDARAELKDTRFKANEQLCRADNERVLRERDTATRTEAELVELRELMGERYGMAWLPGVIFPNKDGCRAVQNLHDNCGDAEDAVRRLTGFVETVAGQDAGDDGEPPEDASYMANHSDAGNLAVAIHELAKEARAILSGKDATRVGQGEKEVERLRWKVDQQSGETLAAKQQAEADLLEARADRMRRGIMKQCTICGQPFEPIDPGKRRLICYAERCMVERSRRANRKRRRSDGTRPQSGGKVSTCAVCGRPPHLDRTC